MKVIENRNLNSSLKKSKRAFEGFVVNDTHKCLFVALLPENEDPSPARGKKHVIVKRLLKRGTSYAVKLPGEGSSCLSSMVSP